MATGKMAKVIGGTSTQFLYTASFYDDRGRPIQTKSINYTGGLDILTTQYDFTGKVLRTLLNHQKNGSAPNTAQSHVVLSKMSYDAIGRMTSVYKNIDGAAADQLISTLQYNELGQLHNKILGNALDNLIYDYNVRGWLTGINKNYVGGTASNYFGMELGYDNPVSIAGSLGNYVHPAFNGNIAGTIWKTAGAGLNRKYDFSYDNANHLKAADFNQQFSTAWAKTDPNNTNFSIDFSVSNQGYDANGNILSLTQNGFKPGQAITAIDQLTYSYTNLATGAITNKLQKVTDGANDNTTNLGDFHYDPATKGSTDYTYDNNGNMVTDNNKKISSTVYNYMNLPQQVTMTGKGTISYIYDADSNKLAKTTLDNPASMATTTLYLDGFVYQQRDPIATPAGGVDTLQFMAHEEGRARYTFHHYYSGTTGYQWDYDFFEKDHLGNTRVLLSQEKDTAAYLASMETAYSATENALFYNIPASSYPRASAPGYPVDLSTTNPNDYVARLNGSGQKVGPAIILKVMSGDIVKMAVNYFYNSSSATNGQSLTPTDLINSLATGIASATGGLHGSAATLLGSSSPLNLSLNNFITNNEGTTSGKPNAYLNWIFLDDQFNYTQGDGLSAAMQVGSAGTAPGGGLQTALGNTVTMTKSGYLYIYVSNATPAWDVFFDNLSIMTYSGPMVEENHYYPFGLMMAGISDKALKANYTENNYKFHGKELQRNEFLDGSGLEWSDFGSRDYDPQIARWTTMDPKAEKYYSSSPYDFVDNDPISRIDPTGMDWFNYQDKDDKEKSWHWVEGHKATYTNADGKQVTDKHGYRYLVTFSYDKGKTVNGGHRGTLTLYDQNKVVKSSSAFSGGGRIDDFKQAGNQNYFMNLDQRSTMPKENESSDNNNHNPPSTSGMQKIEEGTTVTTPDGEKHDVNSDYGNYRIRLVPTSGIDRGLYLHGKESFWTSRTHGCVCEKDQDILQYIWDNKGINMRTPFAIGQNIKINNQ